MTKILIGDCRDTLQEIPESSIHCCVTSPPYWGLRDYGVPASKWADGWQGCLGLEPTPEMYVEHIAECFDSVWNVLRDDATVWLNIGDSYATGGGKVGECPGGGEQGRAFKEKKFGLNPEGKIRRHGGTQPNRMPIPGLKTKDLVGIPWRVAFSLQSAGWYLRSDIIWNKPNPVPESVTDRPTKSHEYVFLLTKSRSYYYDAKAIKEPVTGTAHSRGDGVNPKASKIPHGWDTGPGNHKSLVGRYKPKQNASFSAAVNELVSSRNKRDVWTIGTFPYPDAHYATFPPDLVKPCIMAGCPSGGTVLDPFAGSGTVGRVCEDLGRNSVLCEIGEHNVELIKKRTAQMGLFSGRQESQE